MANDLASEDDPVNYLPARVNPNLAAQRQRYNLAERQQTSPLMQAGNVQFAKELSSMGNRGAIPDLINRGLIANTAGLPVDMLNTVLQTLGLGSEQPLGGSDSIRRALEYYGLSSETQRPMLETLASLTPPRAVMGAARVAGQGAKAVGRAAAPVAGQALENYMVRTGGVLPALPLSGKSGFGAFDPRYDPRALEQPRLQAMTRDVQLNPNAANAPQVSLVDFEGKPFITSMADRTAAGGNLVGIDDVTFNRPVGLFGGQDYMFNNPQKVWASAKQPVNQLMQTANEIKAATGQNPIYIPWRMAPTGGDFSTMTGETMLAYADSAMGKTQKKNLDRAIKKIIPDWIGVSDPASVEQFRNAPDRLRKAIKGVMDVNFRDSGGLNIGGARLAVSDPAQIAAQEGGLQNVGEIFANQTILSQSNNPSYKFAVPGRGLGTLTEDRNIFELLPEVVKARGMTSPTTPRATDLRALQMKPYSGVITNQLLKSLGY